MTRTKSLGRVLVVATAAVSLAMIGGCSGSGGGGGGSAPTLVSVAAQGASVPLIANGQAQTPGCQTGVFLNARITFRFGGPVDPSSLPQTPPAPGVPSQPGPAQGSIQIISDMPSGSIPAIGTWTIDAGDPSLVFFNASAPANTQAGCTAGMLASTPVTPINYFITVTEAGGGVTNVVRVNGTPIQGPLPSTCFQTLICDVANPGPSLADDNPGVPPQVAMTEPATAPGGPAVDLGVIANNGRRVRILVDESLDPTTVTPNNVRLFNVSANAANPVPIASIVSFTQAGQVPGSGFSLIQLDTTQALADGETFELRVDGVLDLGPDLGQDTLLVGPGELRFTINDDATNDVECIFTEDFMSTTNLGSVENAIRWIGNGFVEATFPTNIVGDGSDGPGMFSGLMNLNTDLAPSGDGSFNHDSIVFAANTTLTATPTTNDPNNNPGQTWALQLRSLTTINLNMQTTIMCNGRAGMPGAFNAALNPADGGRGGPGAGSGGIASPSTDMMNPSPMGSAGEGGRTLLSDSDLPGNTLNTDSMSALFGGGAPGLSGPIGANGPSGGGGGTAASPAGIPTTTFFASTPGETQPGTDQMGTGAPLGGAAGPAPAAFMPPLNDPVGGSGGASGGDRLDVNPQTVVQHDTGGSGGGGGGGLRLSAGSDITIASLVTLQCIGGDGGDKGTQGATFRAGGGGGSGGSQLIQCFGDLTLAAGASFLCQGGAGGGINMGEAVTMLDGDGGRGGDGLVQIQDGDGVINGNIALSFVIGDLSTGPLLQGTDVGGVAESIIVNTGSINPDYQLQNGLGMTMAPTTAGIAGSTIDIEVIGIPEDINNPGSPSANPADMVGPFPIAMIDQLDGYTFFFFRVTTSFPAPPATSITDPLPSVSMVQVAWTKD